ncbi:MAG: hypothetical protein E5X64_40300 [Mesorhizobium sp.]|nr:MAG: hypothetical protein E5X64_40300 [Mesorhizobium sp.]
MMLRNGCNRPLPKRQRWQRPVEADQSPHATPGKPADQIAGTAGNARAASTYAGGSITIGCDQLHADRLPRLVQLPKLSVQQLIDEIRREIKE